MKNCTESNVASELFSTQQSITDADGLNVLMEQYKLYVNTMEMLVARRQTMHSIFLTANAVLMTAEGVFVKDVKNAMFSGIAIIMVAVAGILLSWTWRTLSKHYGLMNHAKFEVIHCLERHLPAALFRAEWVALGEGENPEKYQSMAKIETTIPMIFIICYLTLIAVAIRFQ